MLDLAKPQIRKKDLFLWADFTELSCLTSRDTFISFEEIADERWIKGDGIGGIDIATEDDFSSDEEGNGDPREVGKNDLFNYLKFRQQFFSDNYPFVLDESGLYINNKILDNKLSYFYIYLLISSNLSYVSRSHRHFYTSDFECLSATIIRNIFPDLFKVKIFGTANHPCIHSYTGSRRKKLEYFSKDIHANIIMDEDELRRFDSPSGDGGIDIVAWYPFSDKSSHLPVILAQAGCTSDEETLINKHYSVLPHHWGNKLKGPVVLPFMFTPLCYRTANGLFPSPTDFTSVLMDRCRIIDCLQYNCSKIDFSWMKSANFTKELYNK